MQIGVELLRGSTIGQETTQLYGAEWRFGADGAGEHLISPGRHGFITPRRTAPCNGKRTMDPGGGAGKPASLPRVCRACPTAWRWKSFIQPDGGEGLVKRKGCRREAGSEGSVEQSRDPTNRNRIRGLPGRTSGLATAKSSAFKDRGGRSGGCAVKAVELTSGDLRRVPASGTEGTARCPDRGAEVSRGHSRPGDRPKARTVPARG